MGYQKVVKEEEVKNILSVLFFPVTLQQLVLRSYLLQVTSHRRVLISLFSKKRPAALANIPDE